MKKITIALISLLFCLCFITIGNLFYKNKDLLLSNESLAVFIKNNASEKALLELYKADKEIEMKLNGKEIPLNSQLVNGKDTIYLSDIIDSDKLIFRYSELHCNTCIDAQIDALKANIDLFNKNDVIILTKSTNRQYITQFKKFNKIEFPIYELTDSLEVIIPDIDLPYYFIIEKKTTRINSAFVPHKEISDITEKYLNLVKEKYW